MSKKRNRRRKRNPKYRTFAEIKSTYKDDSIGYFWSLLEHKVSIYETKKEVRKLPCEFCGSTQHKLRTIDHIVPRAKHGKNDYSNYASACPDCNNAKGSLDLLSFLLDRLG